MLFVIVNISRYLKIDSESALKRSNRKFKSRFQYMERELAKQGKTLDQIQAAHPALAYETRFGTQAGVTNSFVEAIYKSLTAKK
jgi:hypothetical protein